MTRSIPAWPVILVVAFLAPKLALFPFLEWTIGVELTPMDRALVLVISLTVGGFLFAGSILEKWRITIPRVSLDNGS